ncbi:MAG: hypothetical protein H7329_19695, partial [Opitutaceae bacterium]|nr:hypothetical protein [Cytophagales bacterium]
MKHIIYFLKVTGVCLLLNLVENESFGQCPSPAKVRLDSTDISCSYTADGTVKVTITDSSLYKASGKTVVFRLFKNGSVIAADKSPLGYSKFIYTFPLLTDGSYDVTITLNGVQTFPGCGAFPSFYVRKKQGKPDVVLRTPIGPDALSGSTTCGDTFLILSAVDPNQPGYPSSTGVWSLKKGPNVPVFDPNPPTTTVTKIVDGDYVFNYTVTRTGCFPRADTVSFQVRSTPKAKVSNDTSVCQVNNFNLKATSPSLGQTGTWSVVSGPAGAVISSPNSSNTNVSGLVAGLYKFSWIIDGSVCGTDTAYFNLTNNALPVITSASLSPNPVCAGKSVVFSLNTISATTTYKWSGPSGFTFTHTGVQPLPVIGSVLNSDAGNYSVTATLNGCTSAATNVGTLIVNLKPAKTTISTSANPVCQNQTLILTGNTVSAVTWTLPNNTTSAANPLVINNIQAINVGKYKITVSSGLCNSNADSVTIAVTNVTTPTISQSGSGTYCSGTSFTLTASPSILGATYTWTTPSGGTLTGISQTIVNSALTDAGTYNVTIKVNGCTGPAASSVVNINPAPAQPDNITGVSPVCQGTSNVDYSVTTPVGGVTYNWTYTVGSGVTIIGSGSAVKLNFSNTASPNGTLNVSASSGTCVSPLQTKAITVTPIPSTPGLIKQSKPSVCQGDNGVVYTVPSVAGVTYNWTYSGTGATFAGTTNSISVNFSATATSGVMSLTASSGTCTSGPSNLNVTLNAIPATPTVPANIPVCVGSPLNIPSNPLIAGVYSWNGPNGFSAATQNANIPSVTLAANGPYNIFVTNNGCKSATATTNVAVSNVPAAPVNFAPASVCEAAGNVVFSVTNNPTVTYSWSLVGAPAGVSTIGATNQNSVTANIAAGAGNFSFRIITIANSCSTTVVKAVTVNTLPATPLPSANVNPVCLGLPVTISAGLVASGYSWTLPDGSTSNSQNIAIASSKLTNDGIYSLILTNASGCKSAAGTVKLT